MKYSLLMVFAISALVFTTAPSARAQNCWPGVVGWVGSYTLTGNGTGQSGKATVTINEKFQGQVKINLPAGTCGSLLLYSGPNPTSSGSINDKVESPCPPPGGTETTTFVAPLGPGQNSQAFLGINLPTLTYIFQGGMALLTTVTDTNCSGKITSTTDPIPLGPYSFPSFALPASPQELKVENWKFNAPGLLGAVVPWILSFTLDPVYNTDDSCDKDGGSSIGCQNQSLGEDVPIAGTGFHLHYVGERAPGAVGDTVATADAAMIGGWTLSVHHAYDPGANTLFLGDGRQRNGYQLGTPVTFNTNFLLTSEDGSEVYLFAKSTGRHLQTLRPLTGALKYQFGYDAAGNLVTVTDASGNVTTIKRNASEHATAIVSPYGQTTTLSVDSNGFLSLVTDPAGDTTKFTNDKTGLITARTDAKGNVYNYTYGQGRLIKDADPAGGYTSLTRTNATSGFGWTVEQTTAMGRKSSFQSTLKSPWVQNSTSTSTEQHTNTWPDGLIATSTKTQQSGEISESMSLPDGTSSSTTEGPDPRWGIQVPLDISSTATLGNLTKNTNENRSVNLGTAGNPFSLTTQTDTESVNGRTYKSAFTTSDRTYVDTTPAGRKLTTVLDTKERIASAQVEGLLASDFAYDTRGRLSTVTQGTRKTTFSYDTDGRLASVTDPLGLKNTFAYDANGRLLSTTLADGRVIEYKRDANGNLTSVIPPGKSAHDFDYTPVNQVSEYIPPSETGTGSTIFTYNVDRDITKVTRPDGKTINFDYDSAGRLSSTITPTDTVDYTYSSTTGNLISASIINDEALEYGYNGPLPTSTKWTGPISGAVSRVYNDNFWVTSQSLNGTNTISFSYDNDGLVISAGELEVVRSSENGLIMRTVLGHAADTRTYNSFGELTGYTASYNGATLCSLNYTRDADGRVSAKSETIGGHTNTYAYSYDPAGRLIGVAENGKSASTYSYDTNSNRLKATTSSGTVSATYDAQDRLLTYGTAAYTYTANGELASQTVGTQKTAYQYDVLGNLIGLVLPTGKTIGYVVDAENRRVRKNVNGVLTEGFLYDGNNIVAQLNGSNAIVSQFIYASGSTSPDYMVSGGVTYRIFSDQLGSPRLVVNTSTGAIAERIDYDEFGNVVSDTNPGFQPFGFAGGLYDQDTKLVRFGARDYDPKTGRWAAKDPILLGGGDSNLYGYVLNDPVNSVDPKGLGEDCVCKMPPPAKPPKAVPFGNYTPGVAEIQAMVEAALRTPLGSAPATPSERSNPGHISRWLYDMPNYTDYHGRTWKFFNDINSLVKKKNPAQRPICPTNTSEAQEPEGQEVEPIPDAPETVVEPVRPVEIP
jgi:RHS repeat-associated protein